VSKELVDTMREYVIDVTVTKRVRVATVASGEQEARDDAVYAALHDATLEVMEEYATDTSVVWRGGEP
jgi:uncharacterized NAD(P)/FAD-binding protein YdhS